MVSHVSVEEFPLTMEMGEAEKERVGEGGGAPVGTTPRETAVPDPPEFVAVTLQVMVVPTSVPVRR